MRSEAGAWRVPPGARRDGLSFRLLGPFELRAGGRPVTLAPKLRCVLAALLLQADRSVGTEYLVDVVWGPRPPRDPRAALHSYVLRIRKALDRSPGGASRLQTVSNGYLLRVSESELDVLRLETLRSIAQGFERSGDATAEADALRAALGLWRGATLVDVPSEALQDGPAQRLEETRLSLLERRIELDLSLERSYDLVPELIELTCMHPLRERFWRQLLQAQYHAGQRAEALETYRRAAVALREELGIEPGAELQAVHHVLLEGTAPAAVPGQQQLPTASTRAHRAREPRAAPVDAPGWTPVCQLPRDIPDFTGRAEIVEALLAALASSATGPAPVIVSLSGAPGIGKSAAAVRAAHLARERFPDGQLYARLGYATDPASLAEALGVLLRGVGVAPGAMPEQITQRTVMLRERLADRRVLVVLDGVACADQVEPLLPGTPGCAVLITSRWMLGAIPGVRHLRLGPLATHEAHDLLGRIVGEPWLLEAPAQAWRLAELCRGAPLAVRIVAARLVAEPSQPLDRLIERLANDRHWLDELTLPGLSMRHSIEGAYRALSSPARLAARRVAELTDPEVTASELDKLIDGDGDGDQVPVELLMSNLLDSVDHPESPEPRYRLSDLLVAYARQRPRHD